MYYTHLYKARETCTQRLFVSQFIPVFTVDCIPVLDGTNSVILRSQNIIFCRLLNILNKLLNYKYFRIT